MTTLEQAKKLLGDARIPDDPGVLHEFLTLLDGVVSTHGEKWAKEHKVMLMSQWEYVETLLGAKLVVKAAVKKRRKSPQLF